MPGESAVRIAVLLPNLLGTYGDYGNAIVLAHRLRRRGYQAQIVEVTSACAVPGECDIYLLGGGEDAATDAATRSLAAGGLPAVVDRGATVLAVCAGLQMLGEPGLGVLDVTTVPGPTRAVGETVARLAPGAGIACRAEDPVPDVLTGFENHRGRTTLGPGVRPLAYTVAGVGNGDGTEGVVSGRIVGTYLHGPVLARNPQLADHLLTVATGDTLPDLDSPTVTANVAALRRTTFARTLSGRRRTLRRLPRGWVNDAPGAGA